MKFALLLFLCLSCTGPLGQLRTTMSVKTDVNQFTVRSDGTLSADVSRVEAALRTASSKLSRWGTLKTTVIISVVNTHQQLEAATGRYGSSWLKAWGTYDEVIFQAPSTWAQNNAEVEELLLHELTHCLMFQLSSEKKTWRGNQIPFWFREGMAVFTANQIHHYPSLEDNALWLEHNAQLDVFGDGDAALADNVANAYGTSARAFGFLQKRYGDKAVLEVLTQVHRGAPFERAFEQALGLQVNTFQRDFENFLRLRAFRNARRKEHL